MSHPRNSTTTEPCHRLPTSSGGYAAGADRTRISNAERTERDAGRLRRELGTTARVQADWHESTLRSLLAHRTDERARAGLAALLADLTSGHGLGWSEVARLVGVSVPAVRKWRHGGDVTPTRLNSLGRLAAFLEMLGEEDVQDPAAWLNLPFDAALADVHSKSDIYQAGGALDLLLYAKGYIDYEELLRRAPRVAQRPQRRNNLVMMSDGNYSVTPKPL